MFSSLISSIERLSNFADFIEANVDENFYNIFDSDESVEEGIYDLVDFLDNLGDDEFYNISDVDEPSDDDELIHFTVEDILKYWDYIEFPDPATKGVPERYRLNVAKQLVEDTEGGFLHPRITETVQDYIDDDFFDDDDTFTIDAVPDEGIDTYYNRQEKTTFEDIESEAKRRIVDFHLKDGMTLSNEMGVSLVIREANKYFYRDLIYITVMFDASAYDKPKFYKYPIKSTRHDGATVERFFRLIRGTQAKEGTSAPASYNLPNDVFGALYLNISYFRLEYLDDYLGKYKSSGGGGQEGKAVYQHVVGCTYLYIPPSFKSNNCLLASIRRATGIEKKFNDVRKRLNYVLELAGIKKLKSKAKIPNEYHRILEEIYGVELRIVDDVDKIEFGVVNGKQIVNLCMLDNGHMGCYYKDWKRFRRENKKPPLYIFWDVETRVVENGDLKIYSLVYLVLKEDELLNFDWKSKTFRKVITDNNRLKYMGIRKNADGTLDNTHIMSTFLGIVELYSKDFRVKIIAYFASGFENYFLMEHILEQSKLNCYTASSLRNAFIVRNNFYGLQYRGASSWDPFLFLRTSLKNACDSYKTYPSKLDFSHYKPQLAQDGGFFWDWYCDNLKKIRRYNIVDVLALACLTSYMVKEFKPIIAEISGHENILVTDFMTLPQISSFLADPILKENGVKPSPTYEIDMYTRRAGHAGICDPFEGVGIYNDVVQLDIVSQYPYVLGSPFEYPLGDPIPTDVYVKGLIGIYTCLIDQTNIRYNLVPKKMKGKSSDYHYKGDFECEITSIDIENLIRFGCSVKVLRGYYYPAKSAGILDAFIEPLKRIKREQDSLKGTDDYNPCIRANAKAVLNIQTGNMMIKLHLKKKGYEKDIGVELNDIKIYFSEEEIENPEEKFKKKKRKGYPHITCCIYSYARGLLFEMGLKDFEVLYSDTDSIVIRRSEWERYQEYMGDRMDKKVINEKTGKEVWAGEFGKMQVEGFFDELIVAGKKRYCLRNKGECFDKCECKRECKSSKWRFAGIQASDLLYNVNTGYSFMGSKDAELYRALAKEEPDEIFFLREYEIVKRVHGQVISIKGRHKVGNLKTHFVF